jgi:chromate reductase
LVVPVALLVASLRAASLNRRLAAAARQLLPGGVVLVAWDRLASLTAFDEDLEASPPESVLALRVALEAARGLLVVTPEYNGSMPGHLKTALDWASRPRTDAVLRGMPAAVIGTSPSPGGAATATADVARVLRRGGADVVGDPLSFSRGAERFDREGGLRSSADRAALAELLARLGKAATFPLPHLERGTPQPASAG